MQSWDNSSHLPKARAARRKTITGEAKKSPLGWTNFRVREEANGRQTVKVCLPFSCLHFVDKVRVKYRQWQSNASYL